MDGGLLPFMLVYLCLAPAGKISETMNADSIVLALFVDFSVQPRVTDFGFSV